MSWGSWECWQEGLRGKQIEIRLCLVPDGASRRGRSSWRAPGTGSGLCPTVSLLPSDRKSVV